MYFSRIHCVWKLADEWANLLAGSRLKAIKGLSLGGWRELTDTGLKVKK